MSNATIELVETSSKQAESSHAHPKSSKKKSKMFRNKNFLAGAAGWIWLAIIIIPIYYIIISSLKSQTEYFISNPLAIPKDPTFESYKLVIEAGFPKYFLNSLIITLGSVIPAVAVSFCAAYAIVRSNSKFIKATRNLYLMGLAIPLQATIVPIYLMTIKLSLYDSLLAIILPSIAFAIPISVLILSNFIRDVPKELFESMRVDGCNEFQTMIKLALPLTRPALVTIGIYNALGVWNGFLLPLILTQSESLRVLPLGLWSFQGEYSVNIPAVLASVVLSTLPIVVVYVIGRKQLVSGLSAGFSK